MARKRIVVSSAGGIAAGTPFVLTRGLIVQQASPAVASSARFGQLSDAVLSFTAPGTSGVTTSLVLGLLSDDAGRPAQVVYGNGLVPPADASNLRNVLVGSTIAPGAAVLNWTGNVMVGGNHTGLANTSGAVVAVGYDHTYELNGATFVANGAAVGNSITAKGAGWVAVGVAATVGQQSVSIGNQVTNKRTQSVIVGQGGVANGDSGVGMGYGVNVDARCIAIGFQADGRGATATESAIAIGYQATTGGFDNSIAIGHASAAGAAHVIMIGHNDHYLTELHVGGGYGGDGTSRTLTIRSTEAGYGLSDSPGWNIRIDGPVNTGNNTTGGEIQLRSPTRVASGGTRQTVSERLAVVTGVATGGAPTIRIANQYSGPGAAAGTLNNAPTAGNPADWWEVRFNGNIRYIPLWP